MKAAVDYGTARRIGFDPDDPVQRQAHQDMDSGWRTRIMAALRAELQSSG